jgi:hypothetical protein
MKNTEKNRLKLANAIWDTLTLDDLHEQFLHLTTTRYELDNDAFDEDVEVMGLNEGETNE